MATTPPGGKPQSQESKAATRTQNQQSIAAYRQIVADLEKAAQARIDDVEMAQRAAEQMLTSLVQGENKREFLSALATLSDTTRDMVKQQREEIDGFKKTIDGLSLGTGNTAAEVDTALTLERALSGSLHALNETFVQQLTRVASVNQEIMRAFVASFMAHAERVEKKLDTVGSGKGGEAPAARFVKLLGKKILDSVRGMREMLKKGALSIGEMLSFKKKFNSMFAAIGDKLTAIKDGIKEKFDKFKDAVSDPFRKAGKWTKDKLKKISSLFGGFREKSAERKQRAAELKVMIQELVKALKEFAKGDAGGSMIGTLLGLAALIGAVLPPLLLAALQKIPGFENLNAAMKNLPLAIGTALTALAQSILDMRKAILDPLEEMFKGVITPLFDGLLSALGLKSQSRSAMPALENATNGTSATKEGLSVVPSGFTGPATPSASRAEVDRMKALPEVKPQALQPGETFRQDSKRWDNPKDLPQNDWLSSDGYYPVKGADGIVRYRTKDGRFARNSKEEYLTDGVASKPIQSQVPATKTAPPGSPIAPSASSPQPSPGGGSVQKIATDAQSIPGPMSIDPVTGGIIYGFH